jgi:hypothetical protein
LTTNHQFPDAEVAVKSTFNSDIFVVAATVIPVLYVALAVQNSLSRPNTRATVKEVADYLSRQNSLEKVAESLYAMTLLIAGLAGESIAIIALYRRSATVSQAQWVLICTLVILLFASGRLFWIAMGRDFYAWDLKRFVRRSLHESEKSTDGENDRSDNHPVNE